jgi:hypothetical protein
MSYLETRIPPLDQIVCEFCNHPLYRARALHVKNNIMGENNRNIAGVEAHIKMLETLLRKEQIKLNLSFKQESKDKHNYEIRILTEIIDDFIDAREILIRLYYEYKVFVSNLPQFNDDPNTIDHMIYHKEALFFSAVKHCTIVTDAGIAVPVTTPLGGKKSKKRKSRKSSRKSRKSSRKYRK